MKNKPKVDCSSQLEQIKKRGGNKQCFDCGEKGTTYAVMSFGTFVCSRCAGLLRELNYKVKGTGVCIFSDKEVSELEAMGNDNAKKIWMAKFKDNDKLPNSKSSDEIKKHLIEKYNEKRYYKKEKKKKKKEGEEDDEESDSDQKKESNSDEDDSEEEEEKPKKKTKKKKKENNNDKDNDAKSKDKEAKSKSKGNEVPLITIKHPNSKTKTDNKKEVESIEQFEFYDQPTNNPSQKNDDIWNIWNNHLTQTGTTTTTNNAINNSVQSSQVFDFTSLSTSKPQEDLNKIPQMPPNQIPPNNSTQNKQMSINDLTSALNNLNVNPDNGVNQKPFDNNIPQMGMGNNNQMSQMMMGMANMTPQQRQQMMMYMYQMMNNPMNPMNNQMMNNPMNYPNNYAMPNYPNNNPMNTNHNPF